MKDTRIVVSLLPCECHRNAPGDPCEVCIDKSFPQRWEDVKRQYGIGPEFAGLEIVRY